MGKTHQAADVSLHTDIQDLQTWNQMYDEIKSRYVFTVHIKNVKSYQLHIHCSVQGMCSLLLHNLEINNTSFHLYFMQMHIYLEKVYLD